MAKSPAALRSHIHWKRAIELKPLPEDQYFNPIKISGLGIQIRRGFVSQILGRRSSGRTSLTLQVLAESTRQGEVAAVVDLYDSFHPLSARNIGVDLDRLIWTKCRGNAEHAMRTTDLLLHAGGFGVVVLDLCEASPRMLNRIPLSYWYRFGRAIEHTPTVLLVCADSPQVKSQAGNHFHTQTKTFTWYGSGAFTRLNGMESYTESSKVTAIRPQPVFLQAVV